MITHIDIAGTDKNELVVAELIINEYLLPFLKSCEFKKLVQQYGDIQCTNKSEKLKKPSKKTLPKKKNSSQPLKKPTKKETKPLKLAKKPKKQNASK